MCGGAFYQVGLLIPHCVKDVVDIVIAQQSFHRAPTICTMCLLFTVCTFGLIHSELAAAYLGHLAGGTSTEATDGGSPSSLIACDRGTLIRALGQVNVHISHNQGRHTRIKTEPANIFSPSLPPPPPPPAAQLLAACRSRQDAFPEPDTPLLTWAEFCVVCAELRALKSRKASPQPLQ